MTQQQQLLAPGAHTGYEQQAADLSPVQAYGGALGGDTHAAAEHGTQGAGGALPHLDTIQRAFGTHDVSGVPAYVGGRASEACDAMGAKGYAANGKVGFAGVPDLHTAAHEAAHVVQQRKGVSLYGGVGAAGDVYEQHADAVADKVVAGESAQGLLDGVAGGGAGGAVVQRKPEKDKEKPKDLKSPWEGEGEAGLSGDKGGGALKVGPEGIGAEIDIPFGDGFSKNFMPCMAPPISVNFSANAGLKIGAGWKPAGEETELSAGVYGNAGVKIAVGVAGNAAATSKSKAAGKMDHDAAAELISASAVLSLTGGGKVTWKKGQVVGGGGKISLGGTVAFAAGHFAWGPYSYTLAKLEKKFDDLYVLAAHEWSADEKKFKSVTLQQGAGMDKLVAWVTGSQDPFVEDGSDRLVNDIVEKKGIFGEGLKSFADVLDKAVESSDQAANDFVSGATGRASGTSELVGHNWIVVHHPKWSAEYPELQSLKTEVAGAKHGGRAWTDYARGTVRAQMRAKFRKQMLEKYTHNSEQSAINSALKTSAKASDGPPEVAFPDSIKKDDDSKEEKSGQEEALQQAISFMKSKKGRALALKAVCEQNAHNVKPDARAWFKARKGQADALVNQAVTAERAVQEAPSAEGSQSSRITAAYRAGRNYDKARPMYQECAHQANPREAAEVVLGKKKPKKK